MKKIFAVVCGLTGWLGFLVLFVYLICFLGNFLVPKTVNSGAEGPAIQSFLINAFLIAIFGIHHSIAARPKFKAWITHYVPKHLERTTYVIIANILLLLIFVCWQPMTGVIWHLESQVGQIIVYTLFALGWGMVVLASFLINHFDLFGIRQVYLYAMDKDYTNIPFKVQSLYKYVRNPIMLGWFIAFWATPHMTVGHLVFAAGMTIYGFIGMFFEERTTLSYLGEHYRQYRDKTPMILPFMKK